MPNLSNETVIAAVQQHVSSPQHVSNLEAAVRSMVVNTKKRGTSIET